MKRREMLLTTGTALLGASMFPRRWAAAAEGKKKQKVLFFTRSAGFEHSAIKRDGANLGHAERVLIELGNVRGFDVECTKDGAVFDGDLGKYDLLAFYTSGNLVTERGKDPGSPMSADGKQKLLDAIAAGKGFVGFHAATDSFRSGGIDPYIAMIGSEFVSHGRQQVAKVTATSPKFPGAETLSLNEEWYALSKFAKDLHVILVQETEGMVDAQYQRPPFPATYARMHDKGRVFYTSFGHREDIWTNPKVQDVVLGGIAWALRNIDADVTPNIDQVAPKANQMKN
ncbi:MAG: ThuA domain-containing protein [Planctomycetota bacterium]|nr:ThuA domain-containing protein [Planctomycetota bacterium]